jgi:hypothetical protein
MSWIRRGAASGKAAATSRRKCADVWICGFPPFSQSREKDGAPSSCWNRERKKAIMQGRTQSGEAGEGAAAAVGAVSGSAAPLLLAQVSRYDEKQMAPVSDKPPAILNKVGIAQRLNEQLPLGSPSPTTRASRCNWQLLRQAAGDSGAGLLPVPHALLGGVERADERACRW